MDTAKAIYDQREIQWELLVLSSLEMRTDTASEWHAMQAALLFIQ